MSADKLQLNLLAQWERNQLCDVTIVTLPERTKIPAHRIVLCSQSEYFAQELSELSRNTLEVTGRHKVVRALIRFMYFGGIASASELGPDELLDLLLLAEDMRVTALTPEDIQPSILPALTMQNSLVVMRHDGLARHPTLQYGVCSFIGEHFLTMLQTMEEEMLAIPRDLISGVMQVACRFINSDGDAHRVVQFCLVLTQMESACDLLRETKLWNWGGNEASLLRSGPTEDPYEGPEWCITGVRRQMDVTPTRIVIGEFFDWCIRLDYGAEGKLRIVYESATAKDGHSRCINRFPAAMFAWRVIYRGQDVFNEKPVFICFPENVALHWSTTLPVSSAELTDDDDLQIMVNMAENPMLSLVLYYFSMDLRTTVYSEDILNRLPHIEYRCLSSYSLVKTHCSDMTG